MTSSRCLAAAVIMLLLSIYCYISGDPTGTLLARRYGSATVEQTVVSFFCVSVLFFCIAMYLRHFGKK